MRYGLNALLIASLLGGCTDINDLVGFVDLVVLSDTNGDGFIGPNETVVLAARLRNKDWETLSGLNIQLSEEHPQVAIEGGASVRKCPDMLGGETVTCPGWVIHTTGELKENAQVQFVVLGHMIDVGGSVRGEFTLRAHDAGPQPKVAAIEVIDDPNEDGILSPGETARLRVQLQNDGETALKGATLVLQELSGLADLADDTVHNCGVIPAGGTAWCEDAWALAVPKTVESPSLLELALTLSDENGREWLLGGQVDVLDVTPNLVLDTHALSGDTNGDGVLNPTENAELRVVLYNGGEQPAKAVTVTVTSDAASLLTVSTVPAPCGDVPPGQTVVCEPVDLIAGAIAVETGSIPVSIGAEGTNGSWLFASEVVLLPTAAKPHVVTFSGLPEPEQAGPVVVRIANIGTSALMSPVLSTLNSDPSVEVSCIDVPPGQQVDCPALDVVAPAEADGELELRLTDQTGGKWTLTLPQPEPEPDPEPEPPG